ncbi:YceI family protein [Ktedonospora formicarum]|uniref:Polyisoprenoid-binding protein n=1 Tax=Ktedonospora formicarum TaxID=2778364 RepID=A0A8J3I2H7_9CHLR|nr:YceI family protein [Ktedonospora formicarum]GHO48119.1 polyisoprenoid-binding protein [Ktedonospora formicarum]
MEWSIDPYHTLVEFSVTHLNINLVKGRFSEVQGTLHLDTQEPEKSWVKANVKTASIYTGIAQRDEHLRSPDFFDAQRYPTITFESTRVRRTSAKSCSVTGNLTLRGITRTVSFQVEFRGYSRDPMADNNWKLGMNAVGVVDRRLFDMHWNQMLERGISLLGFETRIELDIEAFKFEE